MLPVGDLAIQRRQVGNKPVVQIWGPGFTDNHPGTVDETIDLINFLKKRGAYVIGGVPTHWRLSVNDSRPNFQSAYTTYDCISPWFIGRYVDTSGADNYINHIRDDKAYCDARNIHYLPTVFSGFAWATHDHGEVNAG